MPTRNHRSAVYALLIMLLAISIRPAASLAQAEDMNLLTAADYSLFATAEPDHVFAYGAGSQQIGELYLPEAPGPHPVVLLAHGGCYRAGYDLRPMSGVARSLTAAGFAVWNIEYRRAGLGGDFPAMFLDASAAADYLREIADEHELQLDSVFVMGHSAGGHLALWLASRPRLEESDSLYSADPLPIAGLVGLAAIADIGDALQQGMCGEALPIVVGSQTDDSAPEEQVDLRQVSPEQLLPSGIPQIHLLGSEDKLIDANLHLYIEAALAAGDDVELIMLEGAGHFELVAIDAPEWQVVLSALTRMREGIAEPLR